MISRHLLAASVVSFVLVLARHAAAEPAFAVEPQVAGNVVAVGFSKLGPQTPTVTFAPSVRIGAEWDAVSLYGHAAYSSAFGLGAPQGYHGLTAGPDVAGVVWRSASGGLAGYVVGGVNAGVTVIAGGGASQTNFTYGFLAGAGIRDESRANFTPGVEAGIRTEFMDDPIELVPTGAIYVALNVTFGGRHQDQAPPPPCPEAPRTIENVSNDPVSAPVASTPRTREQLRDDARKAEDEAHAAKIKHQEAVKKFAEEEKKVEAYKAAHPTSDGEPVQVPDDILKPAQDASAAEYATGLAQTAAEANAIAVREASDPVHTQPDAVTCGPTAIQMIVESTTGKKLDVMTMCNENKDHIKLKPDPGKDNAGTDVKSAPKILEKYGVAANPVHSDTTVKELAAATAQKPALIVMKFASGSQHAIVIDHVAESPDGQKSIFGRDPDTGKHFEWSEKELDRNWADKRPMVSIK